MHILQGHQVIYLLRVHQERVMKRWVVSYWSVFQINRVKLASIYFSPHLRSCDVREIILVGGLHTSVRVLQCWRVDPQWFNWMRLRRLLGHQRVILASLPCFSWRIHCISGTDFRDIEIAKPFRNLSQMLPILSGPWPQYRLIYPVQCTCTDQIISDIDCQFLIIFKELSLQYFLLHQ